MEKTASTKNTTYTLVAIALMTAVICVLAPLSLPIGPVPISMATLVLFLSIYVLGWKKATISVCLYILLGLVGVPVFSGFTGGVSKLAGATGGYIVGYIPMVALAGFLMEQGVDTLICGGIGGGAQAALAEAGIKLYGGVSGGADAAVAALLSGNLGYDPNVRCDHHDHAHGEGGHACGDHGCGHHGCH